MLEIADRSRDGKRVYIDEHVSRRVNGVDTDVSLSWHELGELLAMNDGMSYHDAHEKVATPLEREYVGEKRWAKYQEYFDDFGHELEEVDEAPADLDLRVYQGKELAHMKKLVEQAKRGK